MRLDLGVVVGRNEDLGTIRTFNFQRYILITQKPKRQHLLKF